MNKYFLPLCCVIAHLHSQEFAELAAPLSSIPKEALQTQPPLPLEPEPIENEPFLIAKTKGLVLVSNMASVQKENMANVEGVVFLDFTPPGKPEILRKRLEAILLGEPLTERKIAELKRTIMLYYREYHHPFMMVLLPEQDISNGTLQLVIIESRLGKYTVRGNRFFSSHSIERRMSIKPGEQINDKSLLNDIAYLNRNAFHHTSAVFSPGKEPGTTDIDLVTRDRWPYRFYVGGDNTGTTFTGRTRWFTGVNFANLFGLDHVFSYQFSSGSDIHQFQAHTFSYTAPLFWPNRVTIFGALSEVHPEITDFVSKGKSGQASIRYEIPLPTPRSWMRFAHECKIGFDFKSMHNNLVYTGELQEATQTGLANISQFVFAYHFGLDKGSHQFGGDVEVFGSPAEMLPHQTPEDFQSLRAGAEPKYIYTRMRLSDLWNLPLNFNLWAQARGQAASVSLLPSEQFGLGGFDTVRGYTERQVNADDAFCFNFEVRMPSFYPLKLCGVKVEDPMTFLGFFDYGYGIDIQDLPDENGGHILMSVGPGVRYRITPYLTSRVDFGIPLHEVFQDEQPCRWHISVVLSY
jgi:hemolysin activation/secretion protein